MKNRTYSCIIVLVTLFVIHSCKDAGAPVSTSNISVVYRYSGYDTSGVEVVSGTLTIRRTDSQLSGEKNLGGNSRESGQGSIEGRLIGPTNIELWLNPEQAGSVYLYGSINDGTIQGVRYFDPGAGPLPWRLGTFQAVQIIVN